MRCGVKQRVRPESIGRALPGHTREGRPGMVLDRPLHGGDYIPQQNVGLQVQNDEAGISYVVLHPFLRWTCGGKARVAQSHREGLGFARWEDVEVGPGSEVVEEIQRLRSLHHDGTADLGFSTADRLRFRRGVPLYPHAGDGKRPSFNRGEKPVGPHGNRCALPHRIPPQNRIGRQRLAEVRPQPYPHEPLHVRGSDTWHRKKRLHGGFTEPVPERDRRLVPARGLLRDSMRRRDSIDSRGFSGLGLLSAAERGRVHEAVPVRLHAGRFDSGFFRERDRVQTAREGVVPAGRAGALLGVYRAE